MLLQARVLKKGCTIIVKGSVWHVPVPLPVPCLPLLYKFLGVANCTHLHRHVLTYTHGKGISHLNIDRGTDGPSAWLMKSAWILILLGVNWLHAGYY